MPSSGCAACAENVGTSAGIGPGVGAFAGGLAANVGGVLSIFREQFERRFTDVSYDLLISKTFYFFFYAAFGSVSAAAYIHVRRNKFESGGGGGKFFLVVRLPFFWLYKYNWSFR